MKVIPAKFKIGDIIVYRGRKGKVIDVRHRRYGWLYTIRREDGTQFHARPDMYDMERATKHSHVYTRKPVVLTKCRPLHFLKRRNNWSGVVIDIRTEQQVFGGEQTVTYVVLATHDSRGRRFRKRKLVTWHFRKMPRKDWWSEPFDISWVNPDWFVVDANQSYWKR